MHKFITKYWMVILAGVLLSTSGLLALLWPKKKASDKVLDDVDENDSDLESVDARVIADALWLEFDGLGGSSGSKINKLLKGLSLADFKKVSEQFGTKYRDDILGGEGGWLFGNKKRDLIYWLGAELSDSEKMELRKINPNIPI
ncbi:hypothetical protein [Flagellimonas algicola]|uniref:Annexin n=1 Tax=Flagellimonas algicola TaxID=2583815 RepID=A0ABY2WNB5_9FLAO|nr:hypothetical protein [Allomuricauda algicola]TMU56475.1 hypothetical protein FGG15_02750 [Allomuricauda algicola]